MSYTMGFVPLLVATAAVLSCLPVCFGNTVKMTVEAKEKAPPKQCRGSRCPLLLLEQIYYVGGIEIGTNKQKILVMFDTGSTQLWVASSIICKNNTQYCKKHLTYNHETSKSYVKDGTPATIGYYDGEVKGFYSKDDIKVGSLTVKSQAFVEVTTSNLQDDYSSGVFGLGFPQNGAPDPPFIKMARTKVIDKAVFAFYFTRNSKGSELILGGVNTAHFVPPMVLVPVAPSVHWTISIDKILVNNVEIAKAEAAIVDSGCTHIAGPASLIDLIHKDIGRRDSQGMVYPDCKRIASFPTITFVIRRVNFVLKPQDYILRKNGHCESGFTAVEGVPQVVLGNVWMTSFYTMFDVEGRQVGFARAK